MLVTSDDSSENTNTSMPDFAENISSKQNIGTYKEDRERIAAPPEHHFARVYAQDDEAITRNYYAESAFHSSFWLRVQRWFLVNTFAPQWLPSILRRTFMGYLIALLLQAITIVVTLFIIHLFPTFAFTALLEILVIAFVALSFGTGPSLLATLTGLLLLNIFVLSSASFMSGTNVQASIENLLFLIVGVTISITASQVERARRSAYAERTLFNAVIETVPDSVSVYDAQGRLVRLNSTGRRLEREDGYEPLTRSHSTGKLRSPEGDVLQQEQLPARYMAKPSLQWRCSGAERNNRLAISR